MNFYKICSISSFGVIADVGTTNAIVSFEDGVGEDEYLEDLSDTQKLIGCLFVAAASKMTSKVDDADNQDFDDDEDVVHDYLNAHKWLEKNSPPVIDFTMLRESESFDEENSDDDTAKISPCPLILLTIKVKIDSTEETQWSVPLDAELLVFGNYVVTQCY